MRVFIDTNVLLDVFGKRAPFYKDALKIWSLAERRQIEASISAVSVTNIHYILRKQESRKTALAAVRQVCFVFALVACDVGIVDRALQLDHMLDFEDAVQLATAECFSAECVVTRNTAHFVNDSIPVLTPGEFLAQDEIAQHFK